jgi:hypothetical protein
MPIQWWCVGRLARRRTRLHRSALALTGCIAGSLATAAAAWPLTGKPITAGAPLSSEPPAVAVDSAGNAYVAWANTKDVGGALDTVQYCVLPAGATACLRSGTLAPADSAAHVDRVQVLVAGSTVVVLADVYGAAGEHAREYAPEQEWQSTDGGATFSLVDGGISVADGVINADTAPLNAVIVPGTGVLGYGWNTAGGSPPTFDAFPLSAPPQCSTKACSPGGRFAQLEPASNPDQIGNAGGDLASQQGSNPGVLAVFNTDFSSGPLACPGSGTASFGTAFTYGRGAQSAVNTYNASPGAAGSAWKVAVALADCDVEYPAVGGGPSGFGLLEENIASGATVYHRFDEAALSFATTPLVTVAAERELDPAVSQDGVGGVYATFLGGGNGGPISLAYSSDGGATWSGPAVLDTNTAGADGNLTSSVGPNGLGWAVWTENGSVRAQQFDAADALASSPRIGGTGSSTATTVTVTVTCSSLPCTVTITITTSGAAVATTKAKTVTLAAGTFTIRRHGAQKLTLRLTKSGRRVIAHRHGRLTATVLVKAKLHRSVVQATRTIKITKHR